MKPLRIASFEVYDEGKNLVGVADVELPELSYMSETIKGAGIAGEIDMPTIGQYGSMEMKLNFTSITDAFHKLSAPGTKGMECWAAQQVYDESTGRDVIQQVIVSVRGNVKNASLGKFAVGEAAGSAITMEVLRMKIEIDGKEVILIDKMNKVARFDGQDLLESVRRAVGM